MLKIEEFTNQIWNKENYKKYLKFLISLQDLKYKEFHSSLVLNSKFQTYLCLKEGM